MIYKQSNRIIRLYRQFKTIMEFDLNIDQILEHWDVSHGIREIIANALDEQVMTNTQEIEIKKDKDNWVIRDFGRGIQYQNLVQNENKEKLSHQAVIGKFGIGLKDALATFNRHHIKVLIESTHCKIVTDKLQKHGFKDIYTLHAKIDKQMDKFTGTQFTFCNLPDKDMDDAKKFFLKYHAYPLMSTTRFGDIMEKKPTDPAYIFVNGNKVAEEPNFIFHYNITSLTPTLRKALNRERTNVGRVVYTDRVKQILLNSEEKVVHEILQKELEKKSIGKFADELTWSDVQMHAIKLANVKEDTVYLTTEEISSNAVLMEEVKSKGLKIQIVSEQMKKKIEKDVDMKGQKIMTKSVIEKKISDNYSFKFVPIGELKPEEKKIWDQKDAILKMTFSWLPKYDVYISETIGNNAVGLCESGKNRITIRRDQLKSMTKFAGTLIHEFVHARTGLKDATIDFEVELTRLLGVLAGEALKER